MMGNEHKQFALLRTGGDIGFLIGAAGMGALADWTGMDGWSDANQYLDGVATRQLLNARAKQ
jgi:hypothetical protein